MHNTELHSCVSVDVSVDSSVGTFDLDPFSNLFLDPIHEDGVRRRQDIKKEVNSYSQLSQHHPQWEGQENKCK